MLLKILIVDDDAAIRCVLAQLLESLGHSTLEAQDGVHALEVLDESIDFVFTDMMMPRMSGAEFASALAGRNFCKPVVFMTGTPDMVPLDYKVIVKPFSVDDVIQCVM